MCVKQIVLQNVISESGPLDQPFEEKTTCESVGDVPVHTEVRLQIVDATENILFFWSCLQQVQVFILMSFTHFLELRDAERLYVSTRDLPDATRGKLVVIEASRVLYARIFVYRLLRVITQRCVRARSLSRSSRVRRILSIPECPWPLRTVEYSLCDGDRALVRRNRLKIDLWGSKNGFDRNFRSLAAHRIYPAAAPNRQIDLKHSFLGVWRRWRALCPWKRHFPHTETQN